MSDPMRRPDDVPPPAAPPPEPPRKGSSPLIWILLLVALVALGWYFLSKRDMPQSEPLPPPPAIGDGVTPPAEREPARTPERAPRPSATTAPADRPARVVDQPRPDYPAAALRNREEGSVTLLVQVDAAGKPTDISVEQRSRSRDLDRAAMEAARNWTFEPAIRNGKPEASSVRVPVDFTLEDQPGTTARN
jgi:periplasmic protein TonB